MEVKLNEVGYALRQLRHRNSATLKQVSERTGISLSHIADVERGETNPSLKTVQRLADAYGQEVTLRFAPITELR